MKHAKKIWKAWKGMGKLADLVCTKGSFLYKSSQERPSIQKACNSTSCLLLVYYLFTICLLFVTIWKLIKCSQMWPSAKVFCWCWLSGALCDKGCQSLIFLVWLTGPYPQKPVSILAKFWRSFKKKKANTTRRWAETTRVWQWTANCRGFSSRVFNTMDILHF